MDKRRIGVGDFRIGKEEKEAINEVLDSGRISEGAKVREFERRWAEYIGTKYCVATSSGAGFIGSHLVGRLVTEGAKVRVSDNLENSSLGNFRTH